MYNLRMSLIEARERQGYLFGKAPFSVVSGGIATVLSVGLLAYFVPKLRRFKSHNPDTLI